MRDLLILAIVFGGLLVTLKRPYVGVLLWSWIGYMNPHRFAYGFAFDFPFAAVIAGVTIVSMLFSQEKKRIPWSPLVMVWMFWILWMCFTTMFALVPDDAFDEWSRTMKIQFMTAVTLMLFADRERLNQLVWAIVISLGFFGFKGGVFTILTGGNYMVFGPEGSFIAGNNSLALALVMTLPLMRYLQLNTASKWVQRGLTVLMLLSTAAILASYSRGAVLAIAAMAMFLVMKSRRRAPILIAIVFAIPVILTFMPEKFFQRLETIQTYQQDESAMGRINAWWFAYNVAVDRPIVGGGYDVFERSLFARYAPNPTDFHDAHSIYFEVLGEQGFIGLGIFLLLGWLTLRSGKWVLKHTRDRPDLRWAQDLASMTQVSIIGYAVGGAFLGLAYFDLYYHLIAIIVLTHALVQKALAEEPIVTDAPVSAEDGRVAPAPSNLSS